jgi:hypothetical protein
MADNSTTRHAEHLDWPTRWNKWWSERRATNDWGEFVWRHRIRMSRLEGELGTTVEALQSRPEQRVCLEQLRGHLESLGHLPHPASGEPLEDDARRLVEIAKETGAKTRTQLSRTPGLYEKITAHPQREEIFAALGMQKGFRYLSDEAIVELCEPYGSLTDLKMRNTHLHQEVFGRGLRERVVSTHRWYTYRYIDKTGQQYRSRMELIFANWLLANGIRFTYDAPVPGPRRKPGEKRWRYDFYLPDYDLYIELLHNETPGRALGKTRRRQYLTNRSQKLEYYTSSKLRVCWINTERYSVHNREITFAKHCIALISPLLQRELRLPSLQTLCYNGSCDLAALSAEEILSTLLKDCTGVADHQNHYSPLRHALKSHPEHAAIVKEIRRRGQERRDNAVAKRWAEHTKRYMTYAEARDLVIKLGLKSQKEFQQWAHHGIPGVPPIPDNLPRNPYCVYKRLGGWTSWTDFLGRGEVQSRSNS